MGKLVLLGVEMPTHLALETPGAPAATSLLELATLGTHTGPCALSNLAKVAVSDTGSALATEQHAAGASRGTEGELVEGNNLATGLDDTGASSLSDAQAADRELGHVEHPDVVGDSAHEHGGLVGLVLHLPGNERNGDRGPVGVALEQTLQDHLVERRVGAALQEAVQLDQQLEVD